MIIHVHVHFKAQIIIAPPFVIIKKRNEQREFQLSPRIRHIRILGILVPHGALHGRMPIATAPSAVVPVPTRREARALPQARLCRARVRRRVREDGPRVRGVAVPAVTSVSRVVTLALALTLALAVGALVLVLVVGVSGRRVVRGVVGGELGACSAQVGEGVGLGAVEGCCCA